MLSVRVALCATGNAKDAVLLALRTLIPPKKQPAQAVLKAPIWTTWARFKTHVTQDKVSGAAAGLRWCRRWGLALPGQKR